MSAGLLVAPTSWSSAQVIPTREIVMPPWNSQHVFDPTVLPQLADPDTLEEVPPEDMPVRNRIASRLCTAGDAGRGLDVQSDTDRWHAL